MARSLSGVPPAFLLFSASGLWGGATVLNKALLVTISPVLLLVIQLLASTVALLAAVFWVGIALPRGRVLMAAIALGVLNPGISYTFSLMGLDRISASVSSLLWATEPFLILGLAWLVLREPITLKVVATIAVGFVGVICVSGLLSDPASGETDLVGVGFLLLAVLMCAVYTVFSRKLGDTVDPLSLVAVQQAAGLVWAVLLLAWSSNSGIAASISAVPPVEFVYAAISGQLYFATAYWLYLSALGRVSAALAGGSFNIIPLVTIAVAFVFLGERLSGMQALGAALILLSASALFWLTSGAPDPQRQTG
ncbi:MAG: DMT family transporter [Tabrizicola sp.]|nr:DMT family transporter [Tabrizicola sp.]